MDRTPVALRQTWPFASPRLRVNAAAAYLGLSPRSIRDLAFRRRHGIPALRVGRALIFDTVQLDRWLAGRRERASNGRRTAR